MKVDLKDEYLESPNDCEFFDESENIDDMLKEYSNKYPHAVVKWEELPEESFMIKSLKSFIRNSFYNNKNIYGWHAVCFKHQPDLILVDTAKRENDPDDNSFVIFKNEEH